MRPSIEHLTTAYQAHKLQRKVPPWLATVQDESWARFTAQGLPWRKDEQWKYTSLYGLAKMPLAPAAEEQVASGNAVYTADEATTVVLVNGRYSNALSSQALPAGLSVSTSTVTNAAHPVFSARVARHSVMLDLNAAFSSQIVEISIASGTTLEQPIYVHHVASGEHVLDSPRLLITVGKNCDVTLVEHYDGAGTACVTNSRVSLNIADNSRMQHTRLQTDAATCLQLGNTNAEVAAHSQYASLVVDAGAQLARHDLGVELNGHGAHCEMLGVFLPVNGQHFDHHTFVKHNVAHTTSNQVYRGVAGHRGHGVFNGKVLVQPDAQKIVAMQSNDNILLSDQAEIDTKPELEIYADDVKCSHGATIGQLDETSMFYLQSRGLGRAEARHLLIRGFIRETFASVKCRILKTALDDIMDTKLSTLVEKLS